MKKGTLIIFLLLSVSCNTTKKLIVKNLINDIEKPLNGKKSDTLRIVDFDCGLHEKFIDYYLKAENTAKISTIIDGDYYWDKNHRWSITKEDLLFFDNQIKNSKKRRLNLQLLPKEDVIKSIITKKKDTIRYETNEKAFYSGNYTYCFSNPIFNKKKDLVIISYKVLIPNLLGGFPNGKTIIYKKINNNWIKICEVKPRGC